jgi:hypothetical protein
VSISLAGAGTGPPAQADIGLRVPAPRAGVRAWHHRHVPSDVGFTTYLRVFQPLSALPQGQRERWQSWLARQRESVGSAGLLDAAAAVRAEHAQGLVMAVHPRLEVPVEHEDRALVLDVDGLPYICPLDTQRRVWEAVATFKETLAPPLVEAFVPVAVMEEALSAYDRLRGAAPTPPAVRTATWHVPLAWFLLVEHTEAALELGEGMHDPRRRLCYTTTMGSARRRAGQSLRVLQQTIPEAPTVLGLQEVAQWLEEFHPYSRVQLDYGDLVTQLDDAFLAADTTVTDLAEGVQALTQGDGMAAGAAYERVVRRWRPVQGRESAS